jgi:hypothetical protein
MTFCQVSLATYSSLTAALADWDAMGEARDTNGLVDAALVEGDGSTTRAFHRHARTTHGSGTVAAAVVGLLRPASIVTGAVAGGVGGSVLATLSRGISRTDLARLGEVLDTGPIAFVTLTDTAIEPPPTAEAWATVHTTIEVVELADALDRDASD